MKKKLGILLVALAALLTAVGLAAQDGGQIIASIRRWTR